MNLEAIGTLLAHGIPPGVLATAIEQGGVHGWDRYGRFGHFNKDSKDGQSALDALAAQYTAMQSNDVLPSDQDQLDTPFSRYGWPEDSLPDFAAIAAAAPTAPPPRRSGKSHSAQHAVIGVLLEFIKGQITTKKHPDFESEAQLIDELVDQRGHHNGISKRNLQTVFAEAKRQLKES